VGEDAFGSAALVEVVVNERDAQAVAPLRMLVVAR
jgi:hypothetical protein